MIDPHGMDPQTVLRFVKAVGGWPGKVMVIACEPAEVEEMGIGLSRAGRGGGRAGGRRSSGRRSRSCRQADARALARQRGRRRRSSATPAGSPVTTVTCRVGRLRQVVPDVARVLLRDRRARDGLRGRAARARGRAGRAALRGLRARVGARRSRRSGARRARAATSRSSAGNELEVESIEIESKEEACIART